MENPPLLVRTPPPYHYESLFGFLLRVSELNGYQSPWDVAKLAGMSVNESKSRKLPVGKLTQVLGLDANALNRFSYLPFNEGAGNRFKLLDHVFRISSSQRVSILPTLRKGRWIYRCILGFIKRISLSEAFSPSFILLSSVPRGNKMV